MALNRNQKRILEGLAAHGVSSYEEISRFSSIPFDKVITEVQKLMQTPVRGVTYVTLANDMNRIKITQVGRAAI